MLLLRGWALWCPIHFISPLLAAHLAGGKTRCNLVRLLLDWLVDSVWLADDVVEDYLLVFIIFLPITAVLVLKLLINIFIVFQVASLTRIITLDRIQNGLLLGIHLKERCCRPIPALCEHLLWQDIALWIVTLDLLIVDWALAPSSVSRIEEKMLNRSNLL